MKLSLIICGKFRERLLTLESRMFEIVYLFPKSVKKMKKRRVAKKKNVFELKEIEL